MTKIVLADDHVADHALWWPPSKVVGRYLSAYLAVHHEEMEVPSRQPGDVSVELQLGPAER